MDLIKKKEGFEGQKAIVIPRKILNNQCAKNDIIGTLYITDIGYYPKAKFHYRERPLGADQHIIIYCQEGSGQVRIKKKEYRIGPGDFFVIPIKTNHTYAADENNPWTIYWIHFKGRSAEAIIASIEKQLNSNKGFIKNSDRTISLFNEMYQQLERGYGSSNLMYTNMCLWHFFASFMYGDLYGLSGELGPKDIIDQAIDFLKNNVDHVLTLEEIAHQVNLSPSHFSYLFKKKTGFSPVEYFNHLKVQKACQYLLFTNLRIKEIAYELGIEDPYYFSRLFSKIMSISPNAYREKRIH